ncbi:MAG TPA: alkaline phosphatase family protein, partial [Dyadobacter sp.]|nr:alkaline phosphatase family protein [Dyadobacter sp.]
MTYLKPKLLLLFSALSLVVNAQSDKKKALFVIVDGISAEQLRKVATPNLDAISKVGGFTKAFV